MKEAATMLSGEARRAASILHQTPDADVNSAVGLPPRSGSTIDAIEWTETLAGEATLGRVRGTVWARAESTARAAWKRWRVRVAPPGGVRVAPPERDPRGSGQHCFKELGRQRSCSAKRQGSTAWRRADGSVRASAGSTARKRHLDECG